MARIAHLSDIHFGAHDPEIVAATETWLQERQPDLIIVSGDLTQRARKKQFREASGYLDRLRQSGCPVLVVPGNHDVPLYDIVRRFAAPLDRYKHYISSDLCPWFEDDEVAVLGLNTARSLTIKDGRINQEQLDLLHERFSKVSSIKTRILVTHHPLFTMPIGEDGSFSEAVGRHREAIQAVASAGVHVALAGHYHRTYAQDALKMVENVDSVLIMQAGTATSTRLRNDELQSFNWIHARRFDEVALQVMAWDGSKFAPGSHQRFTHDGNYWNSAEVIE